MATYEHRIEEITGGRAPEEGDLNTAMITSDTPPPAVLKAILDELRSGEHAVSDQDEYLEYGDGDDDRNAGHIVHGELHDGNEHDCYDCNPPGEQD